jgi:hypothetical protein
MAERAESRSALEYVSGSMQESAAIVCDLPPSRSGKEPAFLPAELKPLMIV